MITLTVELAERSYPILIGSGLLGRAGILDPWLGGDDVLLVTNDVVGPIYGEPLQRLLGARRVETISLPDGEAGKTMGTLERVLDRLVEARFGRDCTVITLGGGVTGDIGGFAAAIYQRGVRFVQVPTTLLAQVDSSVGGKTGVNHPGGKNLIGAFHQPACVLADTDTLQTLPDRELAAGLAEVVKYGLILDAEFFTWLEQQAVALRRRDPASLRHAIRRSCEIKARVVAADEREQGQRALLNLGHTFGHAIERCAGYGQWLHGEAVAAGLSMAARFSERLGWLPGGSSARIEELLTRLDLPVRPPQIDPREFLAAMSMDKKVRAGEIRLVLLRDIGEAVVTGDYPPHELLEELRATFMAEV
ncbi:MAG: 3-dehydroquinate synthase [Gammaproteobacteria bacterium]|nr:MAG: 3-dehydroquinate synthase [Gammaproteobacteria bacterium]